MERSEKIRAGIWVPRKVQGVNQVNSKGRFDEKNFTSYQYGLALALPQVWEMEGHGMSP